MSKVKIILSVFGNDLVLEEFSLLSKTKTTDLEIMGQYISGKGGHIKESSSWIFSLERESLFVDEVLIEFFHLIDLEIDKIREFILTQSVSCKLEIVLLMIGEQTPSLYFSREILKIIDQLNADIDIDLYINLE